MTSNRFKMPIILLAALAVAATANAGSITGTVKYEGAVPSLRPIKMDADPGCAKKHDSAPPSEVLVLGDGKTMGNIFVQVKNAPSKSYPVPTQPVVVDQDGCRYVPHVLGVRAGQPLKFLNSDGLLHNVHALPKTNQAFNMAMPASRTDALTTFDKPEPMFKIKCDVHPWMSSYVAVMSHPFFAVTAKDGKFKLDGVPAGTYEVEAWHEKLGTKTMSVTVGDGSAKADFTFSAPSKG